MAKLKNFVKSASVEELKPTNRVESHASKMIVEVPSSGTRMTSPMLMRSLRKPNSIGKNKFQMKYQIMTLVENP